MSLKKRVESLEQHLTMDNDIRGVFINRIIHGDDGPEILEPKGYQYSTFTPTYRREGETTEQLQKRALQQIAPFIPAAPPGSSRPVAIFRSILEADTDV